MQIHSLANQTDLIFPRFDGIVHDHGDHLTILTPGNPTFYWGNFLLFARPPEAGDFERWMSMFAAEVAQPSGARHVTFGWDSLDGESGQVDEFLAAGFSLGESVVLATSQVRRPPRYNEQVHVRPLREEWEWQAAIENQVECRGEDHDRPGYLIFKRNQFRRYRAMNAAGLGEWFGAFLGDQLVADLGIYRSERLGRFQSVCTHPDYRRQGICGALVHQAARHALDVMKLERLVMVADEHYHAARIYESAGFSPCEKQRGLERWPGMG
jgi:GNAT superfamily N-acetyltransferase